MAGFFWLKHAEESPQERFWLAWMGAVIISSIADWGVLASTA
jgi:hypothetical protein